MLANIYMHNVLTLWYKFIIAKECRGDNFLIVYADDFIAGFQYKWEAEKYYQLLRERLKVFGLELEESKSRMIANYKQQVQEMLFKLLNRRSDRKSYTREGFIEMLKYYPLAMPKIYVSLF